MSVTQKTTVKKTVRYRPQWCREVIEFFDVPAFHITEVMKKDGTVSLVETAAELPTFAGFAKKIGTTCQTLFQWENTHPAFKEAMTRARDLQGNILLQNSLRGNYASSFAIFTAKNLLGWKDNREESPAQESLVIRWEEENEKK